MVDPNPFKQKPFPQQQKPHILSATSWAQNIDQGVSLPQVLAPQSRGFSQQTLPVTKKTHFRVFWFCYSTKRAMKEKNHQFFFPTKYVTPQKFKRLAIGWVSVGWQKGSLFFAGKNLTGGFCQRKTPTWKPEKMTHKNQRSYFFGNIIFFSPCLFVCLFGKR